MSATEIIEQIKQLPPDQQQQVYAFVKSRAFDPEAGKYIPREEFDRIADEVLRDYDNLFRKLAE